MRRRLLASMAVAAASLVYAEPADGYTLGWWLKASGSATCVIESGNHFMCGAYDAAGTPLGVVYDMWFDWYCQPGPISGGDNEGTPLRVRFVSPASGAGCYPVGDGSPGYWNQFYGWTTGAGFHSGQNFYNPWYVTERTSYVAPRNPNDLWSVGTTVEIW